MTLMLAQLSLMILLGKKGDMAPAEKTRERETIAALERADATVAEEKGGLTVCWTWTDELVELAARLERMRHFQTYWVRDEPVLRGPELRHLRGHKGLREINVDGMPIS